MAILKVENLNFDFAGSSILNNVTFGIEAGSVVGLIGPNGSGKTSLFNCICGFNTPSAGKIVFLDEDITYSPAFERARLGIGRVFQNFGIFREMTLIENLLVALESRQSSIRNILPWGGSTRKNKEIALDYLIQIHLEERADTKASALSGGQMRLLEIIRTLAYGAEMFLLDEPTAGVSPRMKDDVVEIILKLKSMGKTIIVIEHDINFIQRFCERIIVLDVGQIVLDDKPEIIRDSKTLQDIYFGSQR